MDTGSSTKKNISGEMRDVNYISLRYTDVPLLKGKGYRDPVRDYLIKTDLSISILITVSVLIRNKEGDGPGTLLERI